MCICCYYNINCRTVLRATNNHRGKAGYKTTNQSILPSALNLWVLQPDNQSSRTTYRDYRVITIPAFPSNTTDMNSVPWIAYSTTNYNFAVLPMTYVLITTKQLNRESMKTVFTTYKTLKLGVRVSNTWKKRAWEVSYFLHIDEPLSGGGGVGWGLDNARKTIAKEPHMRFPTLIQSHGTNRKCWAVPQSDTRPRSFCSTQRHKYPATKLISEHSFTCGVLK